MDVGFQAFSLFLDFQSSRGGPRCRRGRGCRCGCFRRPDIFGVYLVRGLSLLKLKKQPFLRHLLLRLFGPLGNAACWVRARQETVGSRSLDSKPLSCCHKPSTVLSSTGNYRTSPLSPAKTSSRSSLTNLFNCTLHPANRS